MNHIRTYGMVLVLYQSHIIKSGTRTHGTPYMYIHLFAYQTPNIYIY